MAEESGTGLEGDLVERLVVMTADAADWQAYVLTPDDVVDDTAAEAVDSSVLADSLVDGHTLVGRAGRAGDSH